MFYIFVNFWDEWKNDPKKEEQLFEKVQLHFWLFFGKKLPEMQTNIKHIKFFQTHLNQALGEWNDANKALTQFKIDLKEKKV